METGIGTDGSAAAELLRAQEMSRYHIAQDDPDPKLRLLAQLAVKATGMDIGGITLIHHAYAAVVTGAGIAPQRLDRSDAICSHAVDAQSAFFEVPDLHAAPRFVTRQFPEMRHYAAATLFGRRGYVLGTLWVMSCAPGRLDESQRLLLQGLGRLAVDALEMYYYDGTTGMHNRTALVQQVQDKVALADASDVLVGYIDLTGFHQINEIHGRDTGDYLLAEFAHRLQRWIGADGMAGHFGGDRFGFALEGPVSSERLDALRLAIDAPCSLPDSRLHALSARIGIVREALPTRLSAGALFDMAETAAAMIGAMHGFSVVREYGGVLRDRSRMLQALVEVLEDAPGAGELTVFYQPQVNFGDGSLIGFEALARWRHPQLGMVPAQTFVALAESSGHCFELDMRIARMVCRMVRRWRDAGLPAVPVSLNLSRASLVNPRLPDAVAALLAEHGLPGASLEVEVTEGQLLDAPQALHACVEALRALGLRIAIDDFGIGYSNLDAIATLRFDRLKVDRRFVHGVADSDTTASLFQLIQGVARVSGAELLCEGLEREKDLDWLRQHHAYCVQGWYFCKAEPAERAEHMLRGWQGRLCETAPRADLRSLFV
ncbi:bifunctional diguanylate cyclase/phosphodiesterase [Massilia sp. G4R7]|uniref:Bifunctional diguanylate cyclase/phosphodiesterase n=1 Tax=Massilia phyllostachyos TaxID=2898585 RepID=A0ABS8Q0M1_9BURK|nr:bifunctional diguanylate cyclase/phosphodiesterase [Massilia phyllostachyos]MCD2515293.1 bifunctional diguanylate cyclase/phosphodiesterase [Massilia phyllostachyos]